MSVRTYFAIAARQAWTRRSQSALIVLYLGIGIGAGSTVFSLLSQIYLKPMPFPDSQNLSLVSMTFRGAECMGYCGRTPTREEVVEWQKASIPEFVSIGTISPSQVVAHTVSGTHVLEGAMISSHIQEMLGATVTLGRGFTARDFEADAPGTIVLSAKGWQKYFRRDEHVVGTTLQMGSRSYEVIGVMAPAFELGAPLFEFNDPIAEYWIPEQRASAGYSSVVTTLVRLREPAGVRRAEARLNAIVPAAFLSAQAGEKWQTKLVSLRAASAQRYRASFWNLFAAVGFLLMITCLNVAGLFLVRLNERASEFGTRVALGATRCSLAAQIISEVTFLSFAGCIVGIVFAWFGIKSLAFLPVNKLPFWTSPSLELDVAAVAAFLTVFCIVVIGSIPVAFYTPEKWLQAMRNRLSGDKERTRIRGIVVSVQIVLSVVMLATAGSFVNVLLSAERRDLGTVKKDVLFVQLQYPKDSAAHESNSLQNLITELLRVPGVRLAGTLANNPKLFGLARMTGKRVFVEGRSTAVTSSVAPTSSYDVSPGYFATMGIRVLAGRTFNDLDRVGATAVAILDSNTATAIFGTHSPIGARIRAEAKGTLSEWLTIVGTVQTTRAASLKPSTDIDPTLYRPIFQTGLDPTTVVLRVSSSPPKLRESIKQRIAAMNPNTAILNLLSMEESIGARLWEARLNSFVLSAFSIIALLLANTGLYAVLSFTVTSRRREFAIRIAMGATERSLVQIVVKAAFVLILPAVGLGLIIVLIGSRLLIGFVSESARLDLVTISVVSATFIASGLFASLLPARHASRTHPAVLLRDG